jgi:hypothetical protein
MSFKKVANATMQDPILQNSDWQKMWGDRAFRGCHIDRDHKFCKTAADTSKYILSHCTIMSSVMTEPDPYDYLIKPECSHLVNNNDDAWTNEVLKLSHHSFVGAFNFVEHFQNSKYAKGHILDALLRKIQIVPEEQIWVYFCDILVATDITHEKLVTDIREGKVRYLSMGCVTDLVICSYCGAHVTDANTYCNHLSFQKGMFLADDDGISRRVAELCGHKTMENGGVKFVEASWVATPAFPGAAKRNIVADEWLGPKSPYTRKASVEDITKEAGFAKAAATGQIGGMAELLLQEDIKDFRR